MESKRNSKRTKLFKSGNSFYFNQEINLAVYYHSRGIEFNREFQGT